MKIEFTKMQGAANDYIYVNCLEKELADPAGVAIAMSPRHFSVGADGLIMICSSEVADAKMRMFNADGSEGKMCGNAIRCVGKYLYDNGIVKDTSVSIETLSGIKYLTLYVENGLVSSVKVDMGYASFAPEAVPVRSSSPFIDAEVKVNGVTQRLTAVSMGNPHAVLFAGSRDFPNIDSLELEKIGTYYENHELFPERVNTEFIEVKEPRMLRMRVWERGSGETWACGTGACAAAAAAVKTGKSPFGEEIKVCLRGGDLFITVTPDYRVYMRGPAVKVYDGIYEYTGE